MSDKSSSSQLSPSPELKEEAYSIKLPLEAEELLTGYFDAYVAQQDALTEQRKAKQKGIKGALIKWCRENPIAAYRSQYGDVDRALEKRILNFMTNGSRSIRRGRVVKAVRRAHRLRHLAEDDHPEINPMPTENPHVGPQHNLSYYQAAVRHLAEFLTPREHAAFAELGNKFRGELEPRPEDLQAAQHRLEHILYRLVTRKLGTNCGRYGNTSICLNIVFRDKKSNVEVNQALVITPEETNEANHVRVEYVKLGEQRLPVDVHNKGSTLPRTLHTIADWSQITPNQINQLLHQHIIQAWEASSTTEARRDGGNVPWEALATLQGRQRLLDVGAELFPARCDPRALNEGDLFRVGKGVAALPTGLRFKNGANRLQQMTPKPESEPQRSRNIIATAAPPPGSVPTVRCASQTTVVKEEDIEVVLEDTRAGEPARKRRKTCSP